MIDKEGYITVVKTFENTVTIQKSKFITTLAPIKDYDDALQKVKEISKKYSDATHNCYAFISSENASEQRFSDDGEPQGTAGIPMLEVLKKRKVYMTLAVVTRYFGGIKLGANGLVGAYSSSVSEALDKALTVDMVWSVGLEAKIAYSISKKVEENIIRFGGQIESIEYSSGVVIKAVAPCPTADAIAEKIVDITGGKAELNISKAAYRKFARTETKL